MAAALAAFSAAGPNASAAASGGAYCRSLGMFMPSCEANAVRKSDGLSMEAVDEFSEEALQEELGRWSAKAPEMVTRSDTGCTCTIAHGGTLLTAPDGYGLRP
eukprot:4579037-Prymnesium_polylepis.1